MYKASLLTAIATTLAVTSVSAKEKAPSAENLRIEGIMMYDNGKDVNTFGLYSYSTTSPVNRECLKAIPRMNASGGSVVKDGKYYTFNYSIAYGYVNSAAYYTYDLSTGTELSYKSVNYQLADAYNNAAVSAAISPDGTVYCSGYDYDNDSKSVSVKLKTWDLDQFSKTTVGDMTAPLCAMAFAADGTLYGITASSSMTSSDGGYIVKIDTATGKQTVVSDTGMRPGSTYDQSAIIDPTSGDMFWFANLQNEECNLYRINLTDKTISLIGALPNGDEVVAAYIPAPAAADAAPSPVKNISATAINGTTGINISFTTPALDYSGSPLTASRLYYHIAEIIDGAWNENTEGKACEAGADINTTFDFNSSGEKNIAIWLSNEAGNSPVTKVNLYAGFGIPTAVSDLSLTREGDLSSISWSAATLLNGFLADNGIEYEIVRNPDNIVIATTRSTSYTDRFDSQLLQNLSYTVTPINGDVTGSSATTQAVTIGSYMLPPYQQDFTEANSLDLYSLIDNNQDSNSWYYSVKSAKYRQSTSMGADDYLIMPPMKLEGGKSYDLSFTAYGTSDRYTNILDILAGTAPTSEALSTIVKADLEYTNSSTTATNTTVTLKPDTDGVYYIAFYLHSLKSMGTFTIDDIVLSAGKSTAVPAAVSQMDVTAAQLGALEANISFTLPTVTAGNATLTAPLSAAVYRNGNTIKTFSNDNPGETLSFTDTPDTAGEYTYTVIVSNTTGDGEAVSASAWIGNDTPAAPTGVIATNNFDGTATITWDQSSDNGLHGGYVDSSALVYTILSKSGEVVKTDIKGNSAIIDIDTTGTQANTSFSVAVGYAQSTAPATPSNTILIGKPYALPYNETFADAKTSTSLWESQLVSGKSYDTSWYARSDQDQNGDGGSADMSGYGEGSRRWTSPMIDLSSTVDPEVTAYVLMPTGGMRFTLQVQSEDGQWIDLKNIEEATQWTLIEASLKDFRYSGMRLGLLGECIEGINFIYVDNITVSDSQSGVVTPTADADSTAVYYNLQGVRIDNPGTGIYIVKRGSTVTKEIIR